MDHEISALPVNSRSIVRVPVIYSVDAVRLEQYVEASVRGDFVSVAHALHQWLTCAGPLLRTYSLPRLLILREAGKLAPPPLLCEIVIAVRDLGFATLRAAMVAPDRDWCALIDSVAASRGIAYRAFQDRARAVEYLLQPEAHRGG